MFPNLRLTVVAILAAITGIGCGLGLFATFRVNHEPLARLAEGAPPLQLAFDRLGLNSQPQMPLEARLPINSAAKVISVPVVETPSAEVVGAGGAVSTDPGSALPAAGGTAESDQSSAASGSAAAPAAPAAQSIAMREDSAAATNQLDAVTAAGDQQLSAPPSMPAPSSSVALDAQQIAAVNATPPDEHPIAPPSAPVASDQASSEQTAAVNAAAVDEQLRAAPSAPAASPPAAPGAEQTAAIDITAPPDHETAVKPAKSVQKKKAAKPKAARAAPARRVARIVRARRTVATVVPQAASQYSQTTYAQPTYAQSAYAQAAYTQSAYTQSTSVQPTYSWAAGTQQAAVKRVQIKRRRGKTPPAAQSYPLPATAGLSGGN